MIKVGIVNYHLGNLKSVFSAVKFLGGEPLIMDSPEDLAHVEKIILPGVGAFEDGISNLKNLGWIDVLSFEVLERKKFFLGICLGMQLLATHGNENGKFQGLNWIEGEVVKLDTHDRSLKIPHIGWNNITPVQSRILFRNCQENPDFYFVHSYIFIPKQSEIASSYCEYGTKFVSSIEKRNIFATQFHPEKSQKNGLQVLKNFIELT
jgi:imidazole glycerol-phosphate synthase subunit HisH